VHHVHHVGHKIERTPVAPKLTVLSRFDCSLQFQSSFKSYGGSEGNVLMVTLDETCLHDERTIYSIIVTYPKCAFYRKRSRVNGKSKSRCARMTDEHEIMNLNIGSLQVPSRLWMHRLLC